jgi:hypothetical protein
VGPVWYHKKHARTCYAKFVVLYPVGALGHVVHSGASRAQNIDALFFVFGWDWYGFDKKRARTRCAELVFLYLVGSRSHVVHSGAFGVQNIDTLFFMLIGTDTDLTKKLPGHAMPNLFFCILWDLWDK